MVAKFNTGIEIKNIASEYKEPCKTLHYEIKKVNKHNTWKTLRDLIDERVLLETSYSDL